MVMGISKGVIEQNLSVRFPKSKKFDELGRHDEV